MEDPPNVPRDCWCSVPIHSGARIAAWISIICAAIMGMIYFPLNLPFAALNIAVSSMLLYGLNKLRPNFYLPYLFWTVISYFGQVVISSIKIIQVESRPDMRQYTPIVIILSFLFFIALMIPVVYLFIVVPYRSYRLLKWEVLTTEDSPPAYTKGDYVSAAHNPA